VDEEDVKTNMEKEQDLKDQIFEISIKEEDEEDK